MLISCSRSVNCLESSEPFLSEVPDLRVGSWDVAGSGLREPLLPSPHSPRALRPQVPALERSQPPLVCQVAMPWTRPRLRAGEPVRAPESRCSGAPLLTRERIIRVRERESSRRPPRHSLGGPCKPTRGKQGMPLQLPVSHCLLRGSDEGTEGLVR